MSLEGGISSGLPVFSTLKDIGSTVAYWLTFHFIWLRWCLKCTSVPVFVTDHSESLPLLLLGRSLLPGVSTELLYMINFPLWYLQKSLFLSPLEGRSFNWWLVIDVFCPLFPVSPGLLKWSLPTCLSKVTVARWLVSARESPYPKITEGFGKGSHSVQSYPERTVWWLDPHFRTFAVCSCTPGGRIGSVVTVRGTWLSLS